MRSLPTVRLLTITASLAGIALMLYAVLLFSINKTRANVETLAEEVATAQAQQSDIAQLQRTADKIAQEQVKLDGFFLAQDDLVGFLETIEGLGVHTGTTVAVDSVAESKQKITIEGNKQKELDTILRVVSIEGSWAEVFHTVSLIETLPLPITITRADYTITGVNTSGEDSETQWGAHLTFNVLKQL